MGRNDEVPDDFICWVAAASSTSSQTSDKDIIRSFSALPDREPGRGHGRTHRAGDRTTTTDSSSTGRARAADAGTAAAEVPSFDAEPPCSPGREPGRGCGGCIGLTTTTSPKGYPSGGTDRSLGPMGVPVRGYLGACGPEGSDRWDG